MCIRDRDVEYLKGMDFDEVRAREAIVMAVALDEAVEICLLPEATYIEKRKAYIRQDKQLRSKQHGLSLRSSGAAAAAASLKP
eukprot:1505858-Prymnesium_polylepis.1